MPDAWRPSGAWKLKFREALEDAFDDASMELLTADYFPVRNQFSRVAPTGVGKTFEFRLHELITNALMDDWLADLVAAAHERRPRNSELSAIAEELGFGIAGRRLDGVAGSSLEEIVQANAKLLNPVLFRTKLPLLEGQVCWVDVPGGGGTGFLVGPDLVITNDHVIERLRKGNARWQDVKCRFDYKQPIDGATLVLKKPTEVMLDVGAPLVDSRPPSKFDWQPQARRRGIGRD